MPDWFHRLHRSRRARNATFAALGILWLGGSAGALLANYVVAESNIAQYRDSEWRTMASVPERPPEWVEQAAVEVSDAGFSPDSAEGYSDARH